MHARVGIAGFLALALALGLGPASAVSAGVRATTASASSGSVGMRVATAPASVVSTGVRETTAPASAASPRLSDTAATTTTQAVLRPAAVREPMKDFPIQPATLSRAQWLRLLEYAKEAGASIVSTDVSWSSYEPNGPAPAGEWTDLSQFVNDARSFGFAVRFQLVGYPQWARAANQPSESSAYWLGPTGRAALRRWYGFVHRVVTEFAGRVRYYEIWNEENISDFWAQGPDPTAYASLLERSYIAIKSVDPSAEVLFGGLSRNDIGFLRAVYASLNRVYPRMSRHFHHFFDMLSVHPYSGNRSPEVVSSSEVYRDTWGTMDQNFLGFEALHSFLAQQGEGWKKIYIGEYGFSTTPSGGDPGVPDSVRARYLTQAFALAASARYVVALCWFYSYATPWDPASWALLSGNYPNWAPTLTYEALRAVPDN